MGLISKYRKIRQTITAVLLAGSAFAFIQSNQFATLKLAFNYWDPIAIADYRIKRMSTEELIAEIQKELDDGNITDAQDLVALAKDYNHQIPEDLIEKTQESYAEQGYRYGLGFVQGFKTGEISSFASLTGSIASDFFIYGDFRDVKNEGMKLVNGEDYDPITLGLGAFGLTTSAFALSSYAVSATGAAAPVSVPAALAATELDKGISVLKSTYKMNKISKPLMSKLVAASKDIVDVKALKKALNGADGLFKLPSANSLRKLVLGADYKKLAKGDFTDLQKIFKEANPIDVAAVQKRFGGVINQNAIADLTKMASETGGLVKSGGPFTAIRALTYADNAKDLSKIRQLTKKFGSYTGTVLKIFGKSAFKLGKLLYWLISMIIAVLGWLLSVVLFCLSLMGKTLRFAFWVGKKTIAKT